MNFSPQELHRSTGSTGVGSAAMADPSSLVISSIAGMVDSIFGTIGDAVNGKTKKDLVRQQGNQQLVQNSLNMHSQRLQYAQPAAKKKNYTPAIILGLVAICVFTILVFTLKKP